VEEFKTNLKELHKLLSTWVVFLLTTSAAFWVSLPLTTQNEILTQFPMLKYVVLAVGFVSFAIARAAPQASAPKGDPYGDTVVDADRNQP